MLNFMPAFLHRVTPFTYHNVSKKALSMSHADATILLLSSPSPELLSSKLTSILEVPLPLGFSYNIRKQTKTQDNSTMNNGNHYSWAQCKSGAGPLMPGTLKLEDMICVWRSHLGNSHSLGNHGESTPGVSTTSSLCSKVLEPSSPVVLLKEGSLVHPGHLASLAPK